MKNDKTLNQLLRENEELQIRLQEAEETLEAIREGGVDALVVSGPQGEQVFTLTGEDRLYRHLVETMSEAGLTTTLDGRILFCNERFSEMLRRPMEHIIGHSIEEFVLPSSRKDMAKLLADAPVNLTRKRMVFVAMDGMPVSSRVSANLLRQAEPVSICMVAMDLTELETSEEIAAQLRDQKNALEENAAMLRDSRQAALSIMEDAIAARQRAEMLNIELGQEVQERKKAEEALRESEQKYRFLYDLNPDGIFSVDADGRFLTVNPACEKISGYTPDELLTKSFMELCAADQLDRTIEQFKQSLLRQDPAELETALIRKDGSRVEVWISGEPIAADGQVGFIYCTAKDITDRKQAERTLQERETRYRELVQNANSAIIRWKSDGTITFFNEYAQSFFGYSLKEILGQSAGILVPDVDSAGTDLRSLVQDIVSDPEHHTELVNENICLDGRRVWMAWTNRAIWNDQGEVEEIFAVGIDVTARKQAEDALRQSQQRLQMAFDAAYLISFEWDIQNNQVRRFMSKEPALPATPPETPSNLETVLETVHPEDRDEFTAKINAAIEDPQGHYENEYRVVHPDGEIIWISERGQIEFDHQGKPIRLVGLAQDITERKKAEQQVLKEYRDTEFVNRILRVFVEDESEMLFDKALAVVQEGLASRHGVFGYISEPGHLMCPSLSKMLETCEVSGKCIHYPPEKWKGLWARALKEKRSYYTNQAVPVPPGHPPILNNLASPILFQGQVIGLLNLANKEGGYTEQDREILDKIAERMAPVLYAWIQRKLREDERRAAEEALRQSNDELSSFNRMMVGRELRMIELKQELNEMCRKAGLPQRYVMDSGDGLPKMPDEREHSQVEDWNKA